MFSHLIPSSPSWLTGVQGGLSIYGGLKAALLPLCIAGSSKLCGQENYSKIKIQNCIFYKLLETNFNICYIKKRKEQPPQVVDFIS